MTKSTYQAREGKKYDRNPFINDVQADAQVVARRRKDMPGGNGLAVFDKSSGRMQTGNAAGFWTTEIVDKTQFIKLYANGWRHLVGLSAAGGRVFEMICTEVRRTKNSLSVNLAFQKVDQSMTPVSRSTYIRGINELISRGFLAASVIVNEYWINPSYIWNGDRLIFAQDYVLAGSDSEKSFEETVAKMGQRSLSEWPDEDYDDLEFLKEAAEAAARFEEMSTEGLGLESYPTQEVLNAAIC